MNKFCCAVLTLLVLSSPLYAVSTTGTVEKIVVMTSVDPNDTSQMVDSFLITMTPHVDPTYCFYGLVYVDDLNGSMGKNLYPMILSAKAANKPVTVEYHAIGYLCVIDQFVLEP